VRENGELSWNKCCRPDPMSFWWRKLNLVMRNFLGVRSDFGVES
jgi:hypothetical protein